MFYFKIKSCNAVYTCGELLSEHKTKWNLVFSVEWFILICVLNFDDRTVMKISLFKRNAVAWSNFNKT